MKNAIQEAHALRLHIYGPEFIANALQQWLVKIGVKMPYIKRKRYLRSA